MFEVNFDELTSLKSEGKKILLDVNATWCGPCKALKPKLELLSEKYPDVYFLTMDIDNNFDYAKKVGIKSVPTVQIFKGDELISVITGNQPESYYIDVLNKL